MESHFKNLKKLKNPAAFSNADIFKNIARARGKDPSFEKKFVQFIQAETRVYMSNKNMMQKTYFPENAHLCCIQT